MKPNEVCKTTNDTFMINMYMYSKVEYTFPFLLFFQSKFLYEIFL